MGIPLSISIRLVRLAIGLGWLMSSIASGAFAATEADLDELQLEIRAEYPGSLVFLSGSKSFLVIGKGLISKVQVNGACEKVEAIVRRVTPDRSGSVIFELPDDEKVPCPKIRGERLDPRAIREAMKEAREAEDAGK
jgi:hypothetical protein